MIQNSSLGNKNTNNINQGSIHYDLLKAACFPADFWFWRNDIPIFPPDCDKCIWDLTDDLRLAALAIEVSKSGVLSVSSGAAAHRHVNDINSTIYHLKVCRNVPPAAFSLWLFRVTPSNWCPFWYLRPMAVLQNLIPRKVWKLDYNHKLQPKPRAAIYKRG